jgi:hypothetical protein
LPACLNFVYILQREKGEKLMDNKLYPPYVDATLPAMIQGDMLVVPFQLNRAVSRN